MCVHTYTHTPLGIGMGNSQDEPTKQKGKAIATKKSIQEIFGKNIRAPEDYFVLPDISTFYKGKVIKRSQHCPTNSPISRELDSREVGQRPSSKNASSPYGDKSDQ